MPRQIGLKDLHFAELTKDDASGVTYSTPVALAGAINAKISNKINQDDYYSDDALEDTIYTFESIDVEIEVAALDVPARALLQGSTVIKGTVIESKDDVPPTGALLFRSKKSNGKYRYVALYKGSFQPSDDEFATLEDKTKGQTVKLKGTFYPRVFDSIHKLTADEDATGVVQATLDAWFGAVPIVPTLP